MSKFRDSFKLDKKDLAYIDKVGFPKIEEHALDFVINRLAPANPKNDGKQTPFRGHPVFKAQHATATCCRSCLYKWYDIPKGRAMTGPEITFAVSLILRWIRKMSDVKA